jgi:hypothetical protein
MISGRLIRCSLSPRTACRRQCSPTIESFPQLGCSAAWRGSEKAGAPRHSGVDADPNKVHRGICIYATVCSTQRQGFGPTFASECAASITTTSYVAFAEPSWVPSALL